MKKIMNFAALVVMTICCAAMVSCGENYGEDDRITTPPPVPTDTTTTPKSTPDPTPADTTGVDPFAWRDILAKELNVDEDRQVESKIIAQRNNGDKDSTILRYFLGFEMAAPDTIRLTQPGTAMTAFTGPLSFPGKEYMPTTWENCDSSVVVTTTKGYKTSYYNVVWKTSHVEGYIFFKGKLEAYRSASETTSYSEPSLYREAYEVVRNDSVYLREEMKNEVRMFFLTRTFTFEKKVVVDHYLRMKEAEKEPEPEDEKVNADEWVTGLTKLVSLTKCLREDSRLWCDVALLEGGDGYTMVIDTYDTDGKYVSREKKFVSFGVCKKTNDYNGVAYVNGGFYPAAITYDAKSRGWLLVSNVSGNALTQSIKASDAVARGIKNFKENNTAFPWPYLTNTSTSKEVNGKKVIEVSGKTSTRSYRGCVVADSSLK